MMDFTTQLFAILLATGLLLVGAEIFVPGGVLGLFGGLALVAAVIIAFAAFGFLNGCYVAGAVLILLGAVMLLWIRVFPRTRIGRNMTVSASLAQSKAVDCGLQDLLGQEGETLSDLRPAGFALLGKRRMDVVSEGGMIARGGRVRVVHVEGNRVVVRSV